MADIFLSYAHQDLDRARSVADALASEGWSVFWDRRIPPGRTFEDYIEQRVSECRVLVVLWSTHAVASKWVKIEAAIGREREILMPVLIAAAVIPFGYAHLHAANLTEWQGGRSLEFEELVSSIERLAPRTPRAAPASSGEPDLELSPPSDEPVFIQIGPATVAPAGVPAIPEPAGQAPGRDPGSRAGRHERGVPAAPSAGPARSPAGQAMRSLQRVAMLSSQPWAASIVAVVLLGGLAAGVASLLSSRPPDLLLTIVKPVGGTISAAGISCGTLGSDCSANRPKGEVIDLTPEADLGFKFVAYTGDCVPGGRTIMTTARTCGATFVPAAAVSQATTAPTHWLTIAPVPTGGTIQGGDISCGTRGSVCSAALPEGASVQLHPAADPGFLFLIFRGDCSPAGRTQMTGPRTCSATFRSGGRGEGLGAAAAPAQAQPLQSPDVIYVPTPPAVVEAMLELAKVGPNDVVYDLGSGDGRIPIAAVQTFKAVSAVGIDIDPQRIKEANENLAKSGAGGRVRFWNEDLFTTPIGEASVVTLFLLPSLNLKLMPKLQKELKPGSRVVSQSFDMGTQWPADQTIQVEGRSVYLWIIK